MSSASRASDSGGEADQVGEQHRDEPALGGGGLARAVDAARPATAAPPSVVPHSPQNFTPGAFGVRTRGTARPDSHRTRRRTCGRPRSASNMLRRSRCPLGSFGATYPAANAGLAPSSRGHAGRAGSAVLPLRRRFPILVARCGSRADNYRTGAASRRRHGPRRRHACRLGAGRRADARAWTPAPAPTSARLGWYLGIWVTMMAAMMLPSATPMVLLSRRSARAVVAAARPRDGAVRDGLPARVDGIRPRRVWALPARPRARPVVPRLGPGRPAGRRRRRSSLAGVYQLTPLKRVCLRHCRTPLSFVMHHWHGGPLGARADGDRARRLVRRAAAGR